MPSRSVARLGKLSRAATEGYVCPSCLIHSSARPAASRKSQNALETRRATHNRSSYARTERRHSLSRPTAKPQARSVSSGSVASSTAINAPSTVPHELRELHQRLAALQDTAGSYVDLSRLQLALRSLESGDPVIRVAILGLGSNGALAARKLARVLLADPLSAEEDWERRLLDSTQDGRGLLLKYGDPDEATPASPLVQTLNVPSRVLRKGNLEILVTTLSTNAASRPERAESGLEDAILVPSLTTPTSAGGRMGFVRYPLHSSLVVAEGVQGAIEYGRLLPSVAHHGMIKPVLSLAMQPESNTDSSGTLNVDLATHALSVFRTDKANGAKFSHEWQASNLPHLLEWLRALCTASLSGLKAGVENLVTDVLATSSTSIASTESQTTTTASSSTVPETKRNNLQTAISTWSESAHRDLELNLSSSLASSSWRRTAWFRLLWRIDDVTHSATSLLRNSWLTEAEATLAHLSGRISEANLATPDQLRNTPALLPETMQQELQTRDQAAIPNPDSVAELKQLPAMLARVQQQSGLNPLFDPPWPQTIHLSRQTMLHTLVPALHRKAQALLLGTVSTTAGTSALALWFWVATSGLGLYEAGAIAALGVVWPLRRLQKLWGAEREGFEATVREEGRRVLGDVEGHLRKVVREGGRVEVAEEDFTAWAEARGAVDAAGVALGKLQGR
ncbi:hypothetical protein MBLNU230_g0492t1 [Neophaeotheca triangularis]